MILSQFVGASMLRGEKGEAPDRAKASPKTETMWGAEGDCPRLVSPANGQSSRLTSVRFRGLQILQGMFALISSPLIWGIAVVSCFVLH